MFCKHLKTCLLLVTMVTWRFSLSASFYFNFSFYRPIGLFMYGASDCR